MHGTQQNRNILVSHFPYSKTADLIQIQSAELCSYETLKKTQQSVNFLAFRITKIRFIFLYC